jgi:hypothetical protein
MRCACIKLLARRGQQAKRHVHRLRARRVRASARAVHAHGAPACCWQHGKARFVASASRRRSGPPSRRHYRRRPGAFVLPRARARREPPSTPAPARRAPVEIFKRAGAASCAQPSSRVFALLGARDACELAAREPARHTPGRHARALAHDAVGLSLPLRAQRHARIASHLSPARRRTAQPQARPAAAAGVCACTSRAGTAAAALKETGRRRRLRGSHWEKRRCRRCPGGMRCAAVRTIERALGSREWVHHQAGNASIDTHTALAVRERCLVMMPARRTAGLLAQARVRLPRHARRHGEKEQQRRTLTAPQLGARSPRRLCGACTAGSRGSAAPRRPA